MEEEKRTTEVRDTNSTSGGTEVHRQTITQQTPTSGVIIFQRVVWYLTGAIIIILLMRLVLQLLGANDSAGFVSFVYGLSGMFAAPFFGIFSYEPSYGKSYLEVSTIVAIIVYYIVGWGIAKLATITRPREEV
jgi:hypothetical protein